VIEILYLTNQGQVAQIQKVGIESCTLERLIQLLSHSSVPIEGYTWFRHTLPLKSQDWIQTDDRLLALKEARLPPAVWRAQRILRVQIQKESD